MHKRTVGTAVIASVLVGAFAFNAVAVSRIEAGRSSSA